MFNGNETSLLNTIVANFSKRAKHATTYTFDSFMQRYFDFASEVKKGYKMSIYDYTNDLGIRDLIEELLQQIPEDLKYKVTKLVDPWDTRFKEATNILTNPIFRKDKPPWWWYRVPKKLIGELKEDIESSKIT